MAKIQKENPSKVVIVPRPSGPDDGPRCIQSNPVPLSELPSSDRILSKEVKSKLARESKPVVNQTVDDKSLRKPIQEAVKKK